MSNKTEVSIPNAHIENVLEKYAYVLISELALGTSYENLSVNLLRI